MRRTAAYERFRSLLVEARRRSGLTQCQLAGRLRKPQSYISKVETGERRLDVIEFAEFAEALQIDVAAFLKKIAKGSHDRREQDRKPNRG